MRLQLALKDALTGAAVAALLFIPLVALRTDVGGSGALTPAPTADVVLDARATGPLYTGFRTASQLALAGLLDGPPAAVEVLDALFGGPPPVLLDFF